MSGVKQAACGVLTLLVVVGAEDRVLGANQITMPGCSNCESEFYAGDYVMVTGVGAYTTHPFYIGMQGGNWRGEPEEIPVNSDGSYGWAVQLPHGLEPGSAVTIYTGNSTDGGLSFINYDEVTVWIKNE